MCVAHAADLLTLDNLYWSVKTAIMQSIPNASNLLNILAKMDCGCVTSVLVLQRNDTIHFHLMKNLMTLTDSMKIGTRRMP